MISARSGILFLILAITVSAAGIGGAVHVTVPDTELTDQNGHKVRLYSDLVKGRKVVVINTIFTTCGTICPLIGVRIAGLQKSLRDIDGQDYSLISISVDPAVDTPERLKDWSARYGARPGWTLLTGSKMDVDSALQSLGLKTSDKLTHSPIALIGRDGDQNWITCNALTPGDTLIRMVRKKLGSREN